ncbi:MAG: hypothetical protein ACJ754_20195 [Pyrinomonadaceae bacterium]
MSNSQDPPIVISGGSVTIDIDEDIFTPNGKNKRWNATKKIKRVEVTINGNTQTFDVPNGKVTVAIHYGNDKP